MTGRNRVLRALAVLALVLTLTSPPRIARADSVLSKIDPALLALMQGDPAALFPVIVEMAQPTTPFVPSPSVARANEALDLLRNWGRPVGGLAIIDSAAGFADSTGINALSLVPTVAYIHYDAIVRAGVVDERPPGAAALDPLPTPTVALPTVTPSPSVSLPPISPTPTPVPPTPTPVPPT